MQTRTLSSTFSREDKLAVNSNMSQNEPIRMMSLFMKNRIPESILPKLTPSESLEDSLEVFTSFAFPHLRYIWSVRNSRRNDKDEHTERPHR